MLLATGVPYRAPESTTKFSQENEASMFPRKLVCICAALLSLAALAGAQTWTPLANQPLPFGLFTASTALLLTDGTVMVQAQESSAWFRLTPDKTGNYIKGTWTQLAS